MQTANEGTGKPLTIAALQDAIQRVKMLETPDQWIVVDPQGVVYQGTKAQIVRFMLVLREAQPVSENPFINT